MTAQFFGGEAVISAGSRDEPAAAPWQILAMVAAVLVAEFALARIVFVLMEIFPSELAVAAAATNAATSSQASSPLATLIHSLVKAQVIAAALWACLFGLAMIRERQLYDIRVQGHRLNANWLSIHLMALGLLIVTRAKLKGFPLSWLPLTGDALALTYAFAFACFGISVLRLLAPLQFWQQYLRQHRSRIAMLGAFTLALVGVDWLGISGNDLETRFYSLLLGLTSAGTILILTWWGYRASFDASSARLDVDQFSVIIGPECLGYQGMTIALVFVSAYIYWNRTSFRFPQTFVLYPLLLVALCVSNCVRVAALVAIGASWSTKVAIFGFHSAAGWVNLLLILLLTVFALNRLSFFSHQRSTFSLDISDEKLRLMPMVVLIAVAVLSLLVSPGFEWPYPIRVLIVGALLLHFRRRLALERFDAIGLPVAAGIVVYLIWRALVPEVPATSAQFAEHLRSAPLWVSAIWLVFRAVGAVVIVPLAEELAFRGYLFDALRRELTSRAKSLHPRWITALTLFVTSVGFGALHSAWVAGVAAGLIYGLVKLRRGRLIDAVIAHAVTNLLLAVQVLGLGAWSYW